MHRHQKCLRHIFIPALGDDAFTQECCYKNKNTIPSKILVTYKSYSCPAPQ